MSNGLIIPDEKTAKALNNLARHEMMLKLLNDIRVDLIICEIEGWDKKEYLEELKKMITALGSRRAKE